MTDRIKPCKTACCPGRASNAGGYCERCEARRVKKDPRASSAKRGYGYQWQKASSLWLAKHPLCVHCLADGRTEPATCVDHIIPHRGNQKLFWDRSNWQGLCDGHHARKTAKGL